MANLKKVVYLTEAQKNELFTQGTITSNGRTITYNQNDIYVTPDKSIDKIIMNGNIHTTTNGTVDLGNILTPADGKANNSIIAPVEETSVATQLYDVDDAFIYNNQLYQVTNTIPTSTTINPNVNCDNTTLLDYIKNICITKNGTLTSEEQIAIQKMLGIYTPPWEFIKEDTFTNTVEGSHTITTDANNNELALTDVIMMFETPVQQTDASKGTWGQIHFYYNNTNYYFASEPGSWTQAAGTSAYGFITFIEQLPGGIFFCRETQRTTSSNSAPWRTRYGQGFSGSAQGLQMFSSPLTIDKIVIPTLLGTGHYKLYGKRKWN